VAAGLLHWGLGDSLEETLQNLEKKKLLTKRRIPGIINPIHMDFFIPEESLIPPRVFDSRVDYGRLPVKSALDLKQERQGRTFRTVLSPLYHCFLTVLSLVVFHILSQFHNLCTLACFF
jgi:hypothetical protein